MTLAPNRLAWLDLETTGFEPSHERILEIGIVITDDDLNHLYGWSTCINPGIALDIVIENANDWATQAHKDSGLWDEVRKTQVTLRRAEQLAMIFLAKTVVEGVMPLCGSSVHFDRAFLKLHMPRLEKMFHYRNVDISTPMQLADRWYPGVYQEPEKQKKHRVVPDLEDTLLEARYLRATFFNVASDDTK